MNKIILLSAAILILSCNQNKKQEITKSTQELETFEWLLGNWKRLNEEKGKETFENWKRISEFEYAGIGFTMQNGDTIKQEKIKLNKVNNHWNLTVKTPNETQWTTFTGVNHSKNDFTCENNEIDFPSKIKYWKNGDNFNASVSGGDMIISFEFEKLKE